MTEDALCRLLDLARIKFPPESSNWYSKLEALSESELISLGKDELAKLGPADKKRALLALEEVPTQRATDICVQSLSLSYQDLCTKIGNDVNMSKKLLHVVDALIDEVRSNGR
jgi:hypothetical protein